MKIKLLLLILLFAIPKLCLGKNSAQRFELGFSFSGGSFKPNRGSSYKPASLGMAELGFSYTFISGLYLGGSLGGIAFSTIDEENNESDWDGDGLSFYLGKKWKRFKLAGGPFGSSMIRREQLIEGNYDKPVYRNANGAFIYLGYTLFREKTFDLDLFTKSLHLALSRFKTSESDPRYWTSQQFGVAIRTFPQNWNNNYSGNSRRTHIHYHHYHGSGNLFFGLLKALAYGGKHLFSLI